MAGRLTEEKITKSIMLWLEDAGWKIICFDFPQSGTGKALHPNCRSVRSKNKKSIIPDIVAVRNAAAVFFENKDKFSLSDFKKIDTLRTTDDYSADILRLLSKYNIHKISYGIGGPDSSIFISKAKENLSLVDFLVVVSNQYNVRLVLGDRKGSLL